MPNQNKQEAWEIKLKNVRGYRFASPNSQKEIKSFIEQTIDQEREKAVKEKVEEIWKGISKLGYTEYVALDNPLTFHPKAIQLDRIENYFASLLSTNNTKEE